MLERNQSDKKQAQGQNVRMTSYHASLDNFKNEGGQKRTNPKNQNGRNMPIKKRGDNSLDKIYK